MLCTIIKDGTDNRPFLNIVVVRPPLTPALVERIREAPNKPGRTEGVRKIALRGRSFDCSEDQSPFRRKRRRRVKGKARGR
jgi:hypothetical protein